MYYDGPELVNHYKRWLQTYREPIEAKLTTCLEEPDPKKAVHSVMEILLAEVIPMALAEMIMFNNKQLEEKIAASNGGCSSCASNLK
ncbi:MAG TPA: hypothetical protein PKA28_03135 [Methylomusa anaerophila]|uniref:Uncharacterized protein n=1 Tax=Methylomusa anaerophila TaxID=1930071 RepID=A0A348ANT0_9FIRM|nr:hypothetical protein [Methylomusa anaerophila]BBB92728.1 hypothetical protein MAMMFC1_03423 [Methylomusa anaerophila]HML87419.1 hypothetical protein [Methylomusa anaerophila]